MKQSEIEQKYKSKAEESFETRRNLFLFDLIVRNKKLDNITIGDFANFKITDEQIKIYATQYFQWERNKWLPFVNLTPDDIYYKLHNWINKKTQNDAFRKYYIEDLFRHSVFPMDQFSTLFDKHITAQKCFYCGITEDIVESLISCYEIFTKRERGYKLEIDRKEAYQEYSKSNSVLCCYWCNNAKTDEFSYTEFIPIGDSFRLLWNKRLEKHHLELIPDQNDNREKSNNEIKTR